MPGGDISPLVLAFEMRHPATRLSAITRLAIALLCLACTGAFAAARGVERVDAVRGTAWMDATPGQQIAPARAPQFLGLLRDGQDADARGEPTRPGLGGPPHSATRFLLAARAVAPTIDALRTAARPPSLNRAPYYATAPPALP
jgi:hypothetical protein